MRGGAVAEGFGRIAIDADAQVANVVMHGLDWLQSGFSHRGECRAVDLRQLTAGERGHVDVQPRCQAARAALQSRLSVSMNS